jgi:hypothetical protein
MDGLVATLRRMAPVAVLIVAALVILVLALVGAAGGADDIGSWRWTVARHA